MNNSRLGFKKSQLTLACSAALILTSVSSFAADEITKDDEKSIEVISIVGHKINELSTENNGGALGNRSVLDTPFSVDVISLEDMEIRQVNTLDSLFSREASVSVDGSAYSAFGNTLRVRGLSLDYTQSFKVNGLSINSFSGELPYEAFEKVTLLKGSTGFMYGMAAPGGIVNYETKRASGDFANASIGYRSDSVLSGHIDASRRFGDNDDYGVRVNLVKEKGDTYIDGGSIDRETASLAFDTNLTDSLTWTVDLIYNDRFVENSWTYLNNSLDSTDSLPDTVSGTRNLAVDGTFDKYKNMIALTSLNWTINDNWEAHIDYDYSKNETRWVKNLDYLLNSEGDFNVALYEQYFDVAYSQIQGILSGDVQTGSITHNIVIGATHQKATTYRNDGGDYGRLVTFNYGNDNLFDDVVLPTYSAELQKDVRVAWIDTQDSVFVSDFIQLNDEWEALVGVRSNGIEHTPSEYFSSHDHYDDTAVTPTFALMFKPNADTTYYASYVESIEGQTSTVGESYENADEMLEPLESLQYELGMKTSGNGWSITSALFRIERGATLVTDDNYLVQEGISIYQGLEFSGAVDITENLALYGDAMLLDTEYDKTSDSTEGNRVAGTPKQQFTVQTNYNVAAVPGLTVNLGAKFHGRTTLDSNNYWELPSYTVVYGGGSYTTKVNNVPVTLIGSVDNLFDKEYWAAADSSGGLRIGEPRTVAFKVKVDF